MFVILLLERRYHQPSWEMREAGGCGVEWVREREVVRRVREGESGVRRDEVGRGESEGGMGCGAPAIKFTLCPQ